MNLAVIGSVAGNTIVTSLSAKLVESIFLNKKSEKKLWVRNTKLELFSKVSHELISCNECNINSKKETIQKLLSKIILLTKEKTILETINNYLFILNEYENAKELINIHAINNELIQKLSLSLYK